VRRVPTLARRVILASIAGLVAMMLVPTSSSATTSAAAPSLFVSLHGEGAWSISEGLVNWQNQLASASSYIDLNYIAHGTLLGKQDLAANNVDFAISGVPFTADQLAGVPGGAGAFIAAPVDVGTLATLVQPTRSQASTTAQFVTTRTICNPDDQTTWPPGVTDGSQCTVTGPYDGPVRIPTRNLAAMMLHYSDGSTPPLFGWNSPDVLRAFGLNPDAGDTIDNYIGQTNFSPGFAGRSDPDEITYYMQQFVKTAAPTVWLGVSKTGGNWNPITERIPRQPGIQRDGAEEQVNQLAQSGCGTDSSAGCSGGGGIAPAPPSLLGYFKNAFPDQALGFVQMQNDNGDWVEPTPATINAAIDAGGDTPLYALTHKVSDAYPLVWVDKLYAPAHGLSVEKTEGLSTLIRYLATTGQDGQAALGEGRLSAPLVLQALQAADQLVTSNCVGSDRKIVESTDPGPLAPATATTMRSIGTMEHCVPTGPPPPPTTTSSPSTSPSTPTTAAPFTDTTFASGQTGTGQSNSSATTTPTVSPVTIVTVPAGKSPPSTKPRSFLLTASKLPLDSPAGASGTDRLTTFLLGAALYLLLRKPLARAFSRLTL
jgi:hypothetical protein